eukprot:15331863-Ditylum_brightwellii.AAC.1
MWKVTRDGHGIMFDGAAEYILGNGDLGGLCCTCIGGTVTMKEFIVTGVHAGDEYTIGCGTTI